MQRQLVYYPNNILRQRADEVREFNAAELQDLASAMRQVMVANNGMGLAAPQVGVAKRVIIVEYIPAEGTDDKAIPFTILVNPQVIDASKEADEMNEGCLSIPYVEVPVIRSTRVTVKAQDIHGNESILKAKGLFARILQHEIDHLDGKLILDYEQEIKTEAKPRTIVWGSTEFTTRIMNTIRPHVNVTHIVTEPPKPSGRKRELTPTVARKYADTLGIPSVEPTDLNDPKLYNYLMSQKPDLMVVAAYGRLIPENLYTLPKHGTLNVHPSLLPEYRGATPIQSSILNGDKETGVTIMQLASQFDTGAIIAQVKYELEGNETYGDLESILAELGGEVINAILPDYLAGKIIPQVQNDTEASRSSKITREDLWLNPSDSPELNERKVRAYQPKPGAFVIIDGIEVKVLQAHLENGELIFDTVQPAGKKPMPWEDFRRGYRGDLRFEPYESIINKQA